jgi:hypothetical protein
MAVTSITYPGTPASVATARQFLRCILAWSPRVGDLELIASELMNNAIQHTPHAGVGASERYRSRHYCGPAPPHVGRGHLVASQKTGHFNGRE